MKMFSVPSFVPEAIPSLSVLQTFANEHLNTDEVGGVFCSLEWPSALDLQCEIHSSDY